MKINNKEVSNEVIQNWLKLIHKGTRSPFAPGAYDLFLNKLGNSLNDLIVPRKKESTYLYIEHEQGIRNDVLEYDYEDKKFRWWLVPVYTKHKKSLFLVNTLVGKSSKIPDDHRISVTKIEKLTDLENIKITSSSSQANYGGFAVNEILIAALIKTAKEELDLDNFFSSAGNIFLENKVKTKKLKT